MSDEKGLENHLHLAAEGLELILVATGQHPNLSIFRVYKNLPGGRRIRRRMQRASSSCRSRFAHERQRFALVDVETSRRRRAHVADDLFAGGRGESGNTCAAP